MKKRVLAAILLVSIVILSGTYSYAIDALGRKTDIILDGEKYSLEAYNIGGNNYFKLRDLAKVLNSTEKKFNVVWNKEANNIEIIPGQAYEVVGNELEISDNLNKANAVETNSSILFNKEELTVNAYNIKNNNYFKLRDLTKKLDIFTGYDNKLKTIELDTSKAYVEESKPVVKEGIEKFKSDIEGGKYKDKAPTKVLDITFIDVENNNKPHVAAIVTDGENNELLHLDNAGKYLHSELLYLNETDLEMFVVDIHNGDFDNLNRTKELYVKYRYEDFLYFLGFEYYEGKLTEYKLGEQVPSDIRPVDGYKIEAILASDIEENDIKGIKYTKDISNISKLKDKYFDENGKSKIVNPYEEENHIRIDIEKVETYKDEKTGYIGLTYTCKIEDFIEDIVIDRIKITSLAIEDGHKFIDLRIIKVEEIN